MRYWLSFDLGFVGPLDPLYRWLADHEAEECGQSVATFESDKTRDELAKELTGLLLGPIAPSLTSITPATLTGLGLLPARRLYLISMKQGGRFILGTRKQAPWAGYSSTGQVGDDTE